MPGIERDDAATQRISLIDSGRTAYPKNKVAALHQSHPARWPLRQVQRKPDAIAGLLLPGHRFDERVAGRIIDDIGVALHTVHHQLDLAIVLLDEEGRRRG